MGKTIFLTGLKIIRGLLVGLSVTVAACFLWAAAISYADVPLKSTNFQFQETALGGVGTTQTSSADYQAASSGAILGFANSAGTNFQINAGNTTTQYPALAFGIISGTASFGQFSPAAATTSTATFAVSDYTSYGYVVQVVGNPPNYGTHTLTNMSTTGPSQAGQEQFGINLVANTSPVSVGANPNHGQFGVGAAASGYGTTNNYRYVSGETVAIGPKSGGVTLYTISYLINVTNLTPAGTYNGTQTVICTGTY